MDKESIIRLGLDRFTNIDVSASDELYDQSNNNHIIQIKLLKANFIF